MTYRAIFDAKIQGTAGQIVFDFSSQLAYGETILSASVTATMHSGEDPAPAGFAMGPATRSGAKVTQIIGDGVLGATYNMICTATTSTSRTLIQTGFVVVSQPPGGPG